jgi:cytochrome c-type biogenesis protein CcmH/NrfG
MVRARVHVALALAVALAACKKDEPRQPVVAAPAAPPPGAGALPPPPGSSLAPMQMPGSPGGQAAALEQAVKANPKDVQSWIQLGNVYFDTKQPQRSIDAYAKALELQPNNPDVLTDQGVMYRDLRAYDRAVANFAKANQLNPQHAQSLFNLGVVYAYDLDQPQKAREAWSKLIATNPGSPQAQTALQALAELQSREQAAAGGAGPSAPGQAPAQGGGGAPPSRFAPITK